MGKEKMLSNLCDALNGFSATGTSGEQPFLVETMFAFLDDIIKRCNFKDEFDFSYSYGPQTVSVYARSKKTKAKYGFWFDFVYKQLYLDAYIENPYNFKNLPDKFIIDFFTMCHKHGFEYIEHSRSPIARQKYPDLHKSFKGNIFRLMRNYFLFIAEHGDLQNSGLGSFRASWSFEKDADTIYEEASIAMKWFYKLNYNLWKVEYLKKAK